MKKITYNGSSKVIIRLCELVNDLIDAVAGQTTVNDGQLTIRQNGVTLGTFTANQSGDTTVNITGGGGGGDYTVIDENSEPVMTFDADYVEVSNHNFVLVQEWTVQSESMAIDTGYCTKVTPFVTGVNVNDVEII